MPPKVLSHSTENHIVPVKPWNIWLRVAQFALAVIILIFVAVPTHYWGGYDAFGVSLFTSIATFIIVPYYVVTASISTKFYNRWAVLGLDILGVVFWLVSFSLLADWAANSHYSYYYDYYWWKKRDLSLAKRTNSYSASRDLAATAAALGAVEFVLFLVTLIFFSISLHHHRSSGYHSTYGSSRTAPTATPATTEAPTVEPATEPKP